MNNNKKNAKRHGMRKQAKQYRAAAKRDAKGGNYQDALAGELKADALDKAADSKKFPVAKAEHKANDPQWYFKDESLLADVASFSYNNPLGAKLWPNLLSPQSWSAWAATIPGLMTVEIGPCIGVSIDEQSPINLAAINLYSYIRYKNSGASNYDAPDLMIYMIAMDSLYMAWNWMKRLYGFACAYSQVNKYKPKAYFLANNVDFDDFIQNLANFRAYLNMAADRISAFCVPATLTYNVRHSWLFSNIYRDSDTTKAQEYMYVPSWFYQFSETSVPSGGVLEVVPVVLGRTDNSTPTFKVADLMTMLNTMISRMSYSEDAGIISGDILKAFENNLFKLSHIDADYVVESVYSAEVLSQIENMNLFAGIPSELQAQFVITQNPDRNILVSNPQFAVASNIPTLEDYGTYINFHHNSPTPKETIVATRLCITAQLNDDKTANVVTSLGSEFAIRNRVYFYAQSTSVRDVLSPTASLQLVEHTIGNMFVDVGAQATPETGLTTMFDVWALTCFDWAPHYYCGIYSSTASTIQPLFPLADWDVYTFIANSQLQAMNELALLTEFNVPD